jgi:predicted AlkP superfamily phosphohydrolase/phosphomutase
MKVIVLALDGFDVNLLSLNEFSYLAALYKNGVSSHLMSTIPYTTPTAFATMQTGKDAGKHGISGFLKFDGITKSRLYNGSDIEDKTFYEILHEYKKRCFIMGLPYNYPPRISGDIVFDWLSGKSSKSLIHPTSLVDGFPELAELRMFPDHANTMEEFMERLQKETIKLLDIITKVFRSRKYDFCFFYVPAPDRIQHKIAVDIAEGNNSASVRIAKQTFQEIDNCIKTMNSELRNDEALMIMSDHGFTTYNQQFFINDWLKENGFLTYGRSNIYKDDRSVRAKVRYSDDDEVDDHLRTVRIPKSMGRFIRKHQTIRHLALSMRMNLERSLGWSIIDTPSVNLDASQAVCFEALEQGIYLNRRVLSNGQLEDTKKELIKKLSSSGVEAYDRNELYSGPKVNELADVYLASSRCCFGIGVGGNGFEHMRVGAHRREGILLMLGNSFTKHPNAPTLLDLAPTILHLMDVPVPVDMQGHVLSECFIGSSELAERKTKYIESSSSNIQQTTVMNEEEEEIVRQRLKDLGYI